MNTQNYASLEASKRLHDAGIELETEAYWIRVANSPMMLVDNRHGADEYCPAPSMAEVWRELAKYNASLYWSKNNSVTFAVLEGSPSFYSINPADALIDLLIWVKEKKQRTHCEETNRPCR